MFYQEVSAKDSQPDDLNQLIGFLVASPSLEVLNLHSCLPTMLSNEPSGGQTIHLPRLFTIGPYRVKFPRDKLVQNA